MRLASTMAVAKKEWRELTRDRLYLSLAFVLPTMMMLLFGYSMSQDVEHVKISVLDLDKTAASRDYISHFTNGKYFDFKGDIRSMQQVRKALENSEVKAVIVIPSKFQYRLDQGLPTEVQTLLEGSNTISIRTIQGYIDAVNGAASTELQTKYFSRQFAVGPDRAADMMQPLTVQVRYLYNEEIKSIWMMAPDLIVIIVMWAMPMLMSLSVVREKETGSIFNLNSSTTSRWEFLLGKLVPVAAVCTANSFFLWAIAVYYFQAPFRGNPWLFSISLVLYVAGVTSVGLLASVFFRTQQAALMVMIIVGAIIGTRYSGMFIPLADMDTGSYVFAHLFPPAYFNTIVEGSFLKGAGWSELRYSFIGLALYPLAAVSLAHLLFRKVNRQ